MSSNLHGLGGGAAMVVAPKPQALKAKPRSERVPIEHDVEQIVQVILEVAIWSCRDPAFRVCTKALREGDRSVVVAAAKHALLAASGSAHRAQLAEFINRVERPSVPVSCREKGDAAPSPVHVALIKRVIDRLPVPSGQDFGEFVVHKRREAEQSGWAALVRLSYRGLCGAYELDLVWELLNAHHSEAIQRQDRDAWKAQDKILGTNLAESWFEATEDQRELVREVLGGNFSVVITNAAKLLIPVERNALLTSLLQSVK